MRHYGWIAFAGIAAVIVLVLEIVRGLYSAGWAGDAASIAVGLVGLWLIFRIAKWADAQQQLQMRRDKEEQK